MAKLEAQSKALIGQIAKLYSSIKQLLDSPLITHESGKCTCTLTYRLYGKIYYAILYVPNFYFSDTDAHTSNQIELLL